MDLRGTFWIAGSAKAATPKLPKDVIDVICENGDRLTEFPVAAVTREKELITIAHDNSEARVIEIVVPVDMLEVQDAGVERQGLLHVAAANRRNNRHAQRR
jgi:hypothetical protein